MKRSVAVAASSQLAADAGAAIAAEGGNAVDAAIAATLTSMNTEPGVCALGGGGFVTIWHPESAPITIDGYAAVPGLGQPEAALGEGGIDTFIEYGGGVRTIVGPGSIAVPGGVSALGAASERFGDLPWSVLFEPTIAAVEDGFPLPNACHQYLIHSADCVFGQDRTGWDCLHDEDGQLKGPGTTIHVPDLGDSLRRIADRGSDEFYSGELGRHVAEHVQASGGPLSFKDLTDYESITRPALETSIGSWIVATNPTPAIGGAILTAMLALLAGEYPTLPKTPVARQLAIQELILSFRHRRLNHSPDIETDLSAMLGAIDRSDFEFLESASTVHTSAADATGLACSITMSTGYGSGTMPSGTGIWLNNCLGELELNPLGLSGRAPGTRLPSNMAPTVARNDRAEGLAIGSPGADRITTALVQVLHRFLHEGEPLERAIAAPRLHVEFRDDETVVAHEPGIELPDPSPRPRPFENPSMYFGGVSAASTDSVEVAAAFADPRRAGGTRVVSR